MRKLPLRYVTTGKTTPVWIIGKHALDQWFPNLGGHPPQGCMRRIQGGHVAICSKIIV